MTDKVHSSFGRTYRSREMAAVRGFALEDVVIPNTTRLVEDSEGNLFTGALNAFNYVSASGLDVTIDTGEAVVGGTYLATDDQHTVTVTDATTTTIYVGWQDGQADTVIVGTSSAFTSDDPKTAIWDITASGGSVTGQTDQRNTDDYRVAAANLQVSGIAATDLGVGSLADKEVLQRDGSSLVGGELWPVHVYGDGGDGAITRSANANENGVIKATTYTVDAGVTMTVTTGLLVIMATESITIDGTIDASEQGANGGGGGNGNNDSNGGGGNNGGKGGSGWLTPDGPGGAGGSNNASTNISSPKNNGGAGGDGDTASWSARAYLYSQPVDAAFRMDDNALVAGAGGGGGAGGSADGNVSGYDGNGNNGTAPGGGGGSQSIQADRTSADGGAGGKGGGMVILIAPTITGSGTIDVSGGAGANGSGSGNGGNGGGGGGGTAGVIGYFGLDVDRSGLAENNSGGAAGNGAGNAGAGAVGDSGWTIAVTP